MKDYLDKAKEELKRADHLIFVSLKYTRTCDIIKHVVERFISCSDCIFEGILMKEKERGNIQAIPPSPTKKCELVREKFKDDPRFNEFLDRYLLGRKINRASFERSCEFRRHVTMTVNLEEEGEIKLDIDKVTELYRYLKEFLEYVEEIYATGD